MVPVFALATIIMGWSHSVRKGKQNYHFIWQQALHWLAVYIALKVVFVLLHLGRLPNDGASFVLMTIMSLATFLAGIYINWRFLLLGIFIALATIFAALILVSMPPVPRRDEVFPAMASIFRSMVCTV